MKYLSFLLLFPFIINCTSANPNPKYNFGDNIILDFNKTTVFVDAISLKFINIEDSRCPKNVQCPWEGFIDLTFTIFVGSSSKDFKIQYNSLKSKSEFMFNNKNYVLNIISVLPYPETTNKIAKENYKVELTLNKSN